MTHQSMIEIITRLALVAESLRTPKSLAELAEITGACRRTIMRDMKHLRELGATIRLRVQPYTWQLARPWSFWNALKKATSTSGTDRDS